jgi:MYXO-CTERM domain-containing protein
MSTPVRAVLAVFVFAAIAASSGTARAQCCNGYMPATACADQNLTRSRWCIQSTVPTGQAALTKEFCSYGDKVVTTLEKLFNIPAKTTFEYQLDTATGGAHTGTSCGMLGDGVAYDAFKGSAYGATGFWGYLLALHEAINDWTGMASGGWPTDWWADHQSAFPNLMDFHIMNTIGVENNDQNLIKAAAAQKKRFYPGGDSSDPKVVALDNVFTLMPNGDGYAGFSHMFAMVTGDGIRWDGLGVPNPDVKRSEYVVAYMGLAAGQSVLKTLQGPGANGGGNICNGTPDGTASDKPYTCSQANVDAIATAHCAANANGKKTADMQALRSGNYMNVPAGPCGATCPGECACDGQSHCVAAWLGSKPINDAGVADAGGTGAAGMSGTGAAGTGAAGTAGGTGAAGTNGGTGASGTGAVTGVAGAGGSAPTGGGTGDAGAGTTGVAGAMGTGTGAAGGGAPTGAGTGAAGMSAPGATTGAGCACALSAGDAPVATIIAPLAPLAALFLVRRRRPRR